MSQQFSAEDNTRYLQEISDHFEEYLLAEAYSDDEKFAKIQVEELTLEYAEMFERCNGLIKHMIRLIPDFPLPEQIRMMNEVSTNNLYIATPYIFTLDGRDQLILDTSKYQGIDSIYLGLAPKSLTDNLDPDFEPYRNLSMSGIFYIPIENAEGDVEDHELILGFIPLGLTTVLRRSYQLN